MKILLRKYNASDCETISELFFETVHTVNAGDYTAKQLYAWASDADCLKLRRKDLERKNTLIAETGGTIVGFGSIV